MVLRDSDITITHSEEDGYPLNDLHAARLELIINGEARQNAWTTNMPRIAMAYDEGERLLRYTATSRDGAITATATLDADGWEIVSAETPQYDTSGDYTDGWRKAMAVSLLTSIGIIEPPKGRWARLIASVRSAAT